MFVTASQFCARQNATAFLELWALVLVLCGAAAVTLFIARQLEGSRRTAARCCAAALLALAALTGVLLVSGFYGCSATAPSNQGLPSQLPAATFTLLRCLGVDVFALANGWILFTASCIAAIVLLASALVRWRGARGVVALLGSAVCVLAASAIGFFLVFAFSWCRSERLLGLRSNNCPQPLRTHCRQNTVR